MKKLVSLIFCLGFLCSCVGTRTTNSLAANGSSLQIHDIQGCGHTSPYVGKKIVDIQGIVTWKDSQGFYMQGEQADDLDCTSEAIYVFTQTYPNVIPGDLVSVNGRVNEFVTTENQTDQLTNTEIESSAVKVISSRNSLPAPVIIGSQGRNPPSTVIEDDNLHLFDPISDGLDYYESLEDMRVEIDQAIAVEPENSYRELSIISGDLSGSNILSSQGALIATGDDENPERIVLDLPDGFNKTVNLGAQFTSPIIGILTYTYGNYAILETNMPIVQTKKNTSPSISGIEGNNSLRIATYNTENLNRFDESKVEKIARQIVNSLGSPDILILEEIQDDSGSEDDGTTSAAKTLSEITQSISSVHGPSYSFIDAAPKNNSSGGVAGGNIRTTILYRTDRGLKLVSTSTGLSAQNLSAFSNSRIPIVDQFSFGGQIINVIGVHLVSNNANSPLFGSVQPIVKPDEEKRVSQAKWLAAFSGDLQAEYPNSLIVLAGDFNDTPDSITLQTLKKSGFEDLAESVPVSERYSIIFEGNAYLYDQILLKNNSIFTIKNASILHLNTWLNDRQQTSDHDPFVADLTLK